MLLKLFRSTAALRSKLVTAINFCAAIFIIVIITVNRLGHSDAAFMAEAKRSDITLENFDKIPAKLPCFDMAITDVAEMRLSELDDFVFQGSITTASEIPFKRVETES